MNVNPTQPGQTRGPAPERPKDAGPAAAIPRDRGTEPEAAPNLERADQVELSEAARELQDRTGLAGPEPPSLEPERLREILQRVSSGYYDRPEVRDEVLRRLQGDLADGPSEA